MLGEELPDFPRIRLDGLAVPPRDAERLEGNSPGVQHPQDVVVGLNDQRRGLGKGRVLGEDPRIDVPVRSHDGEVPGLLVQRARRAPGRGIGIEAAVFVKDERVRH